jgi:phage/plasmid-associated DNA primase
VVGASNSGKGTLVVAMRAGVGEFAHSFSANVFRGNDRSGTDEARQLSWVEPLYNKRLLFSNELKLGSALDGNIIKSFVSGGDELTIRKCHGHEQNVVVQATPFLMLNSVANIEPCDGGIRSRVHTIEFDCPFVEDPDAEMGQRLADPTVKDRFASDVDYQDAALHLVVDAYREFATTGSHPKPPGADEATRDNVTDGDDFGSRFVRFFDLTPDDKRNYATGKEISGRHEEGLQARQGDEGGRREARHDGDWHKTEYQLREDS